MWGLGTLLAGITSLALQTFGELTRFTGQFRVRSLLVIGWLGLWIWLGFYDAFNLLFWTTMLLLAWRVGHRSSYDRMAGRWLRGMWRKWRLYEPRWEEAMRNLHMTKMVHMGPDKCPTLGTVTPMPYWDEVRVKPLPGDTAEDWDELTDALCETFDVDVKRHRPRWMQDRAMRLHARSCRVVNMPGQWIRLEIARGPDPLADPIALPAIPERSEDVDLEAVPIGMDDRGQVVTVPVIGSHLLVGGITGAGKGSLLHTIILNLGPLIRDGSVRIWGFDPKRGVEMQFVKPLCYRFCEDDNTAMTDMLEEALEAMNASLVRLKADRARKISPSPDRPLNIVIIDELGRLTGPQETPQLQKRLNRLVGDLVNVGRAPGVGVVAFCQVPLKEIVQNRDEFPRKIAMHLESREYVDRLLGPGALKAGAKCHEIDLDMPGVAFMKVKGVREPSRIRVYHVTDDVIVEAAARFAPPVIDEPPPDVPVVPVKALKPAPVVEEVTALMPVETVDTALADLDAATDWADVEATGPVVERSVTISVPDCPPSMNSPKVKRARRKNPKGGWIPSGREQAETAWKAKFAVVLTSLELRGPLAKVGPLRAAMVFTHNDRYHRDLDNHWIAVKALGDAVQIAGLIPADTPEHWELSQSINPESQKGMGRSTVVTLSWDEPV